MSFPTPGSQRPPQWSPPPSPPSSRGPSKGVLALGAFVWLAVVHAVAARAPVLGALACVALVGVAALLVAGRLAPTSVPPTIRDASGWSFARPGWSFGVLGLTFLGALLGVVADGSTPPNRSTRGLARDTTSPRTVGTAEGATASTPAAHNDRVVTASVAVQVQPANERGEAWDGAGDPPDIALCVIASNGTRCYPEGTAAESVPRAQCMNATACTFPRVELPIGDITLRVVDVDLAADDLIGAGGCGLGATCTLGRARVTVEDAQVVTDRERRQQEETEARFRAMTPAQHLDAARAELAHGCPAQGESSAHLDEAGRHFGALPRRYQQSSEGRAITDAITRCMAPTIARDARRLQAAILADRLVRNGMVVQGAIATDEDNTTLRIISPGCSPALAVTIARTNGRWMRGSGFRRFECVQPGWHGDTFPVDL